MMKKLAVCLMVLAMGVFLSNGIGCATGGGGGGGGGTNLCAGVDCPDGQECDRTTGQCVATEQEQEEEEGQEEEQQEEEGEEEQEQEEEQEEEEQPEEEQPALVKTSVSAGHISGALQRIQAGDDLVVFATSETSTDTIAFIIPTESDRDTSAATEIPGGTELYGSANWIVAGKKVALVRSNNVVAIYDTTQPTTNPVDIPAGQITLAGLPTSPYEAGHMTSDGNYIAAINDMNEVDDGNAIKVIDVSGATAVVTSFPNPTDVVGEPDQVAVDADTQQVAAYWYNFIYVFDITNPTAAPLAFEFNLGSPLGDFHAQNTAQMQFDGGYVLYHASSDGTTALLNTMAGTVTDLSADAEYSMTSPMAMNGGSFGYFPSSEGVDQIFSGATVTRTAIGTVDAPGSLTLADQLGTIPDGSDCLAGREDGKYGYGSKMAITLDGERWFISGEGAVDEDIDFLQMSTGGDFTLFDDPDDDTMSGYVMASDVSTSANTLAFWALRQAPDDGCFTDDEWVVGFIVLDRLN